jgi:hypothetical protein
MHQHVGRNAKRAAAEIQQSAKHPTHCAYRMVSRTRWRADPRADQPHAIGPHRLPSPLPAPPRMRTHRAVSAPPSPEARGAMSDITTRALDVPSAFRIFSSCGQARRKHTAALVACVALALECEGVRLWPVGSVPSMRK